MLPDERYITVEDAAKQIHVQPITLQRWLAVGTMPHVDFEGTGYVLQADVDACNEACLCRNQKVYTPNPA
jgi:excisionase family DNA binding protein